MEIPLFFVDYFIWHYSMAIKDIIGICRNFIWFIYNFFSVSVVLRSFFSPWKRLNEQYEKGSGLEGIFSAFIVNTMMRIVGMIIRGVTLLIAGLALFFGISFSIVFLVLWAFVPFIVVLFVYQGIHELLI